MSNIAGYKSFKRAPLRTMLRGDRATIDVAKTWKYIAESYAAQRNDKNGPALIFIGSASDDEGRIFHTLSFHILISRRKRSQTQQTEDFVHCRVLHSLRLPTSHSKSRMCNNAARSNLMCSEPFLSLSLLYLRGEQ